MMGDVLPAAGEDLHRPCLEMSDGKEQTKFMQPRKWEATLVSRLSLGVPLRAGLFSAVTAPSLTTEALPGCFPLFKCSTRWCV